MARPPTADFDAIVIGAGHNGLVAANLLVVRADLPDEVAFRLTGLLFAHRTELERAHQEAKRLNESSAVFVSPLQLHPGAKRWYAKHL